MKEENVDKYCSCISVHLRVVKGEVMKLLTEDYLDTLSKDELLELAEQNKVSTEKLLNESEKSIVEKNRQIISKTNKKNSAKSLKSLKKIFEGIRDSESGCKKL